MSRWFNRIGSDKWNGHLIAGPCAYEGYDHACFMLDKILPICVDKRVNLLYKTSFDKANRTSADLVVDFRSIPIMQETGHKVCIDATHSTQMPGGNGESSGGDSQYAKYIMRSGLICGADIVFAEVHNDPFDAPSDSETQLDIEEFKEFVGT